MGVLRPVQLVQNLMVSNYNSSVVFSNVIGAKQIIT